ncbi:MAG: chromosomal replication initiator protein DnaA [Coriobacteriia bacterium]|nr:chromosomal replication initiator protein DnaA [Coriobacteriia bacterium]
MQQLGDAATSGPVDPQVQILWDGALDIVKGELNELVFKTWFRETEPLGVVGDDIVVSVSNTWGRDWLRNRYSGMLATALTKVSGTSMGVKFVVRVAGNEPEQADLASGAAPATPSVPADVPLTEAQPSIDVRAAHASPGALNPRYTFDNFVAGDSNRLAYTCALAVAETPVFKFNPLFIYGGSGLGKTHLLQAVGIYISTYYPHLKVRYVDSQHMVDEFTESIRQKTGMDGFRRRYRENDVLLVDDIQSLIGKEKTQDEFFRTFKFLYDGNKPIILTSDRPPHELETLQDRLITRFNHGMIADISPPELETRVAILKRKVESESGLPVPNEVLTLIAERASANVRELEGALIRVKAFATLTPSKVITLDLAKDVLKGMFPERATRPISVQTIQHEVCKFYGLSMADLISNKRSQNIVYPRQIAMYLVRELTDLSLPRIGAEFGGRDHTTVIHAFAKIQKLLGSEREVFNQIQKLTNQIKQKS